jgi:glutathione S-transferase
MLKIYGLAFSSPSNKVRYVANYLQLPYEFKLVDLGKGQQRTPEYLKINPYGRVPAIDDSGFTLSESNAIIRYLAAKQDSSLYPTELKQRALVDQWLDFSSHHVALATSKLMFNTYFYKMVPGITCDERSLEEGRKFLNQFLPIIEQQLSQHPYIAGDTLTLADFGMLSALDVCELVEVDLSSYPTITQWRSNLMRQPFYATCHENYTEMFNKQVKQA